MNGIRLGKPDSTEPCLSVVRRCECSPTCGALVLIMSTVMELSATAAPKVYRALIIQLAYSVNQETRSQ